MRMGWPLREACPRGGGRMSGRCPTARRGCSCARDLHAEVAVPVLARAQVADKGLEGPHLTARVLEVDAVQEFPASLGAEPANGLQVVTPVASADDEAGLPASTRAAVSDSRKERIGTRSEE